MSNVKMLLIFLMMDSRGNKGAGLVMFIAKDNATYLEIEVSLGFWDLFFLNKGARMRLRCKYPACNL